MPADRVRLASLEPQATSDAVRGDMVMDPAASACGDSLNDKRLAASDYRPASFDQRFATPNGCQASADARFESAMQKLASSLRLPADPDVETAVRLVEPPADAAPAWTASRRHVRPGQTHRDSVAPPPESIDPALAAAAPLPEEDHRTAIYDIAAGAVYLPGGRKLEAHSGIGDLKDNPRHVRVRMRGATPPNVYKLTLRERPFHGVRALRLTPVNDRRMHGRDGILAHSYLLGPTGQSHGCVAFKNYPEFLNAFLKGEVTRLVAVERLETPPDPKLASGRLPDEVKEFIVKASDSSRQLAAASER